MTLSLNYYFIKIKGKGVNYILGSFIFTDTIIYIYYILSDIFITQFDEEEESVISNSAFKGDKNHATVSIHDFDEHEFLIENQNI